MDDATPARKLNEREWREAVDRKLDEIPFPPMVVIHRGWLNTKITRRTLEELQAEDRAKQEKASRGWWSRLVHS